MTINVRLRVITNFIGWRSLNIFRILPRYRLDDVEVFTGRHLRSLVIIVAPIVSNANVGIFIRFFPMQIVAALNPRFFGSDHRNKILHHRNCLGVRLRVPLKVARTLFATYLLLGNRRFRSILFYSLDYHRLNGVAFSRLTDLRRLGQAMVNRFRVVIDHLLVTQLIKGRVGA